jgi:hypothetical protein
MSLLIFFGGTAIVIIVGLAVVIHGYRQHYLEAQKNKGKKAT